MANMRVNSGKNDAFDVLRLMYQYSALDSSRQSMRLLQVWPSEHDDRLIECEIIHTTLTEAPPYVALSYTWGDKSGLKQILVQDQVVPVTINLWHALQRLRPRNGEPLVMWVDAICINQADIAERSVQTSKMRTIYQNAESVAIWVGLAYNNADLAVQFARALSLCKKEEARCLIRDPESKVKLEFLVALFRRQYWWRIWVIQEVSVAKKAVVYCGVEAILWAELDHVCDILKEQEDFLLNLFYQRPSWVRTLTSGGPRGLQLSRYSPHLDAPPLLELLLTHKSKKSTDPKDKVIALVGISQARNTFGPIDYSRTLRDIYAHTARLIISSSQKLDVICVKQHDHLREGLPTWTPDWSRPGYLGILPLGLHHREPRFAAARDSVAEYEFSKDGYVLRAAGYEIDTIAAVGMPYKKSKSGTSELYSKSLRSGQMMTNWAFQPLSVKPALHIFHDWWNLFAASVLHPQSSSAQAIFARSISCGHWSFDENDGIYEEKLRSIFELSETLLAEEDVLRLDTPPYRSLSNSVTSLAEESEDEDEDVGDKEQLAVAIYVTTMMNRRRLFISQRGIVGMAPWDASEGDIVVVLLGCRQPIVLRKIEGHYIMIGEAYVDGYMEGKAMKLASDGNFKKATFKIH